MYSSTPVNMGNTAGSKLQRHQLPELVLSPGITVTVTADQLDGALVIVNPNAAGTALTLPSAAALVAYLQSQHDYAHLINTGITFDLRVPIAALADLTVVNGAGTTSGVDETSVLAPGETASYTLRVVSMSPSPAIQLRTVSKASSSGVASEPMLFSVAPTGYTDANQVATAAETVGGVMRMSPTANRTITTPTAAALVAEMTAVQGSPAVVNSSFTFDVINNVANTSVGGSITLVAGAGVTLLGNGSNFVLRKGETGSFLAYATNVGAGTEAVTIVREDGGVGFPQYDFARVTTYATNADQIMLESQLMGTGDTVEVGTVGPPSGVFRWAAAGANSLHTLTMPTAAQILAQIAVIKGRPAVVGDSMDFMVSVDSTMNIRAALKLVAGANVTFISDANDYVVVPGGSATYRIYVTSIAGAGAVTVEAVKSNTASASIAGNDFVTATGIATTAAGAFVTANLTQSNSYLFRNKNLVTVVLNFLQVANAVASTATVVTFSNLPYRTSNFSAAEAGPNGAINYLNTTTNVGSSGVVAATSGAQTVIANFTTPAGANPGIISVQFSYPVTAGN